MDSSELDRGAGSAGPSSLACFVGMVVSAGKPTVAAFFFGLLGGQSFAQDVIHMLDGVAAEDYLGYSVSGLGDVDGDRFPDFVVGAPGSDVNGQDSGSATVYSGKDGHVIYMFTGEAKSDGFGTAVGRAGDIDDDGYDDILIGAPFKFANSRGRVYVFSGKDGALLHKFNGEASNDRFGWAVAGGEDVDGDGVPDIVVGASLASPNGVVSSGSVYVYSGATWALIHRFDGDGVADGLGFSVAMTGDTNGDGFGDVLAGAPCSHTVGPFLGVAKLFSGNDGSVLQLKGGIVAGEFFGYSVAGIGDADGDGLADIAVGSPTRDGRYDVAGAVTVYSGLGEELYSVEGSELGAYLGLSVGGAGDVNADGLADVLAGSPNSTINGVGSGCVVVLSGTTGDQIHLLCHSTTLDQFGWSVAGLGDVNLDGFPDLIVGARTASPNGLDSGAAYVISGQRLLGVSFCGPANLNSTGQSATVIAIGSPVADDNNLRLLGRQMPQQTFGYFLASETQAFVPFAGGSQGNLCLGGKMGRFAKQIQNSGTDGEFMIQVDLTSIPTTPPHTVMAGETWNFQAWFRDKNPGNTSNFTDAVSVLFQ